MWCPDDVVRMPATRLGLGAERGGGGGGGHAGHVDASTSRVRHSRSLVPSHLVSVAGELMFSHISFHRKRLRLGHLLNRAGFQQRREDSGFEFTSFRRIRDRVLVVALLLYTYFAAARLIYWLGNEWANHWSDRKDFSVGCNIRKRRN